MKIKILILIIIIVTLIGVISGCFDSKETLPVEIKIKIKYKKSKYKKDDNIKLDVHFDILSQKPKAIKIVLKTDDVIKIKDPKEYYFSDVNKIDDKKVSFELSKPFDINDHGEIRAHLYTYDENGTYLYGVSRAIYYHVSDERVLLGRNGLIN